MNKVKFGVFNDWHILYHIGTPNVHNRLRYGQAFLVHFYDFIKGDEQSFSDPDLFHERDRDKAYKMILKKYVEI